MPQFSAEDLRKKSDEELATIAESNHPLSADGILIAREWQRRDADRQLRWLKFSAILATLSTLTAAIAGALLSYMLSGTTQP